MKIPEKSPVAAPITLVRAFGVMSGTMLVAGIVIGSGVFKKIVPLAQSGLSAEWILAAWVVAGLITICGALNLSGMASLTEESGGVYEYLRLSFGHFASFLFGWTDFAIIGSASVAALAFIFAQSMNALLPLPNPAEAWAHFSIGQLVYPFADSGIKLLAIGTAAVLTWVNYRGVSGSGHLSNVFTAAKIGGILLLVVAGLFLASPESGGPAAVVPVRDVSLGSAFFGALLSVFWAYDGWVDLSFVTGEIKNPRRNVPRAIIGGVGVAVVLYVLVNYVYLRTLPLAELAAVGPNEIGAAVVAEALLGKWGKTGVTVLISVSVFGTLNSVLLSHTRVHFRMAQEGFFFKSAAVVHPRYRTPHRALFYTLAWSSLLIVSGSFEQLTDLVIFATFLFYGLLAVAVVKMKRQGRIPGPVPGYPFVQLVLLLFAFTFTGHTVVTQPIQSLLGLALILTGLPFFLYFRRQQAHS
ncbi:amino acid permease [Hymenobacter sp. BT186]|uniref:Amino acid permease n=1 Tax=Hymenobacter telluris TaxID=2816474 RepID=A0A939EXK7_9BACT|nr:amino acid permease [Hymenobacter telluris]MBO0359044.1 amino acid permease [Hymenobacter telluris]MBW3375070.1 amino acid permease [Hymenobacter norwichensis]